MWGKLNLPIFLFNVGLLTLINIDSLMVRTIKESTFIRVNNPKLKRNIGKFNLPHIWDREKGMHIMLYILNLTPLPT